VSTIRQRLLKWSLTRFLHRARRTLVRDPSPARIRRDMARFDSMMARSGVYTLSSPVALEHCSAQWLDAGPCGEGRVILYLHGGAFVAESPRAHCAMLSRICRRAGARGFYVNYRLAPEHPFPAATDDCLDAYRHLLVHGVDPARIVIAGDSAGGNLALVTALRVREAALPAPAALVMISPVLDASFSGDSIRRNDGLDPLFRSSIIERLAPYYVREDQRRHPWVSPLEADLSGLPPSLVIVGSSEILLDDSVRFASRAGTATLQVWHDMPHVFPAMHGLAEAEAAVAVMGGFVAQHTAPVVAGNTAPAWPDG
jgi:acetyl esterase/lipase